MHFETLVSGFGLIEGPRVDGSGNLYFSDVPNGGVRRLTPEGELSVVIPKRRGVGGIALHADGGLVVSGRNIQHVHDGEIRLLYENADVAGFNDLFADGQGRILVGSLRDDPFDESLTDRRAGELYRISAPGEAEVLYGDVGLTNGIGFSPGGDRLYHSDSAGPRLIVHDVAPDGTLSNRRHFPAEGLPDGLAVDAEGFVWVAMARAGRVRRFSPDGEVVDELDPPSNFVTSVVFGGPDLQDLYIVTADNTEDAERGGTVFRTRVDVAGQPAPLARV
jgi:sugar lactone lactonase YvrE